MAATPGWGSVGRRVSYGKVASANIPGQGWVTSFPLSRVDAVTLKERVGGVGLLGAGLPLDGEPGIWRLQMAARSLTGWAGTPGLLAPSCLPPAPRERCPLQS